MVAQFVELFCQLLVQIEQLPGNRVRLQKSNICLIGGISLRPLTRPWSGQVRLQEGGLPIEQLRINLVPFCFRVSNNQHLTYLGEENE